jgi:hypothetical protein
MPDGEVAVDRLMGLYNTFLAAPTAGAVMGGMVAPLPARLRVVRVESLTAGTTPTVVDIERNGFSMWRVPSQRPGLDATGAPLDSSRPPDTQALQAGDVLVTRVVSAGGHTGLVVTAALERP